VLITSGKQVFQRLAVAASCIIFYILLARPPVTWASSDAIAMFAVAILAACAEKLCSIMNLVAVEKDWVSAPRVPPPP
jgi:iron-regulated transporter 1